MILNKILLFTLCLMLIASISFAQTPSDNIALVVKEDGRIGIGTDTPGGILDVEGSGQQILSVRRYNPNPGVDKRGFTFDDDSNFNDRSIYVNVGNDTSNSGAMFFRTHTWADAADYRFEDEDGDVHHILNNKGDSWLNSIVGNVGIGLNQPDFKLHIETDNEDDFVVHDIGGVSVVDLKGKGDSWNYSVLRLWNDCNDPKNLNCKNWQIEHRKNRMNHFEIEEYDGKNWHTRLSIAPGTGNIGIGTDSPSEKLHVVGKINATGGLVQSSDKRLKEDIQSIKNSLEKISAINGVSFKWLDKNRGEKKEIGVIAQDVEKVFPEVVVTDANGYKAVDYAKMIAPLIEAVKTLKSENELLKKQVVELTERVNEIEGE